VVATIVVVVAAGAIVVDVVVECEDDFAADL
jgi:hypothetical protein